MVSQPIPFNDLPDRSYDRHNLLIGVKLRRAGENWFNARLSNLSPTGFRVQSFAKLEQESVIYVMLPGFDGRKAKVMWTRDHEAGCQFERPLHPAIFDHIIRMSRLRARHDSA
ncbi:PilZ domain-containing protein [Rhizorhapis sp.]|uniref:PilZ domain-containing protein n=1 Tax=Rhizorhapis sp. TaxID=1968842 RepID=UPI002B462ADC|nr:PilZ domain-containing protein [Rhizorhapis sp.]HKR16149.1 PilZ domain-containing protein [Rhizorhapis sp.]HKX36926.1 PilZ domain-containing protein [Rhizorhapis sp.]